MVYGYGKAGRLYWPDCPEEPTPPGPGIFTFFGTDTAWLGCLEDRSVWHKLAQDS